MDIEWEPTGYFLQDGKPFIPAIFEADSKEEIPEGFNAVLVTLPEDLEWAQSIEKAADYIEKGIAILWELELGLFNQLSMPLSNRGQFSSLAHALHHFDKEIWQKFKDNSLGVSLFKGEATFEKQLRWNSEEESHYQEWLVEEKRTNNEQNRRLFAKNLCLDYINLLLSELPADAEAFAFFDASMLSLTVEALTLFSPDDYEHLRPIIKGLNLPLPALNWGKGRGLAGFVSKEKEKENLTDREAKIGLTLPIKGSEEEEKALKEFVAKEQPFRVVSEKRLTLQWDGLDFLLVSDSVISQQGRRKLQGFSSAGGETLIIRPFSDSDLIFCESL